MKICEYCFNDEELKAIVKNNNGTSGICPNCGAKMLPHRACAACGYYKGKQVLEVKEAK